MPVTARLSQRFYEKFGDEFTQELVDWLNQVDASYRDHSRELNDLNFARFDAKVEQRFALADSRLEQRIGEVEVKLGQRINEVEVKLCQRINDVEVRLGQRINEVDVRLGQQISGVAVNLQALKSDLVKWMFLFWTGTALANLLLRS